ncbi:MAG: ribonuclease P protein component [Spirochaetaceae bacterium]|nr:ribonuclease P protein component [Spirochaetaceae bacterium]
MEKRRYTFPKAEKVRKKAEIDRVFRSGKRFSCKGMGLRVARNSLDMTRAVFVTVRSFSGAVERNRAKRRAREAWRLIKHRVSPGFDVAIVLYPENATFDEVSSDLFFLLRKAGIVE